MIKRRYLSYMGVDGGLGLSFVIPSVILYLPCSQFQLPAPIAEAGVRLDDSDRCFTFGEVWCSEGGLLSRLSCDACLLAGLDRGEGVGVAK